MTFTANRTGVEITKLLQQSLDLEKIKVNIWRRSS